MSCLDSLLEYSTGGLPGFTTDFPCSIWCRVLTSCLLYVAPLFGNLAWKNICKFEIMENNSFIIWLCFFLYLNASLYNTLFSFTLFSYLKYFSHSTHVFSFYIDVVLTLSNSSILASCQLDPWERISVKSELKRHIYHARKMNFAGADPTMILIRYYSSTRYYNDDISTYWQLRSYEICSSSLQKLQPIIVFTRMTGVLTSTNVVLYLTFFW